MPPSTNTRARQKQQLDQEGQGDQQANNAFRHDLVADNVKMYPVFCTANIPPEILDEFIDEASKGCFVMVDDGDVGSAPCILQTTDLNSITHGSRKPMQAFDSPFLGKTDADIRTFMQENKNNHFASLTFTVFDEETIKNKTCRIGDASEKCDERILLADFYTNLVVRVTIEMGVRSLMDEELLGTGRVYNRAFLEEQYRIAKERRNARMAKDKKG